ncbi:hypothetical protein K1719_027409 [Acacia pycnantha]|nr:hypothetical protein K1719_027409 [Acacia pycnantha]
MDDLGEPLSPMAQCFDSPSLRTYILAVLEFEVAFPYDSLLSSLDTLLSFPRFNSILVRDKINGVKRWERVEVKLEDHIIEPTISLDSMKCFSDYLSKISLEHLPYSKPLWQVHVINYNNSTTTIVFKVHHSIGDGFTFMGVILSCLKRAHDPSLPLTFPSLKSSNNNRSSHIGRLPCSFISTTFTGIKYFGWSLLKSTWFKDDTTPVRSGNKKVQLQPAVISSIIFPMDRIKDIKSKLEVTVNDVITGIIFLGIRLYMQDVDNSSRTKKCTLLTVMNTRNVQNYETAKDMRKSSEGKEKGSTAWGNQCSFMHVSVPKLKDTKTSDPLGFVWKVHHKMKKMKKLSLVYALLGMLMKMKHQFKGPEAVAKHMHKTMSNSSLLMSNMIGPLDQMAAANCPIKSFYFTLSGAPQSLAITVISYMGMLRVTTRTEEGFIDEKKLTSYLNDAFEIIHKAALDIPADKAKF